MSDFTVGAAIGLCVGLLAYKLFALMVEATRDYDQEMYSLPDSPVGRAYTTGYDHGQIEGDRKGYLRGYGEKVWEDLGLKTLDPGTGRGSVVNFPSIQDSTARYSEDTQSDVQPELELCPVCGETLPSTYESHEHAQQEQPKPYPVCAWCGKLTADHPGSTFRRHRKQAAQSALAREERRDSGE